MKYVFIAVAAAVVIAIRVSVFRIRRRRRAAGEHGREMDTERSAATRTRSRRRDLADSVHNLNRLGDVGTIAMREITERVRGRIFRVGTLVILVAVAAAIVIPALDKSSSKLTPQTVGVVGSLSPLARHVVRGVGSADQDSVTFVSEPSLQAAKADLLSGRVDFVIVDGVEILLDQPVTSSSSSIDTTLVENAATYLGVLEAYRTAGLTPAQIVHVVGAKPVAVHSLRPGSKSVARTTSVIGIVLLFVMLTQYCTWILIGVMQEKSSRVVEVLLATVRPIQLLGGKVLGIGLVALGQAVLVVAFALVVAKAVGSDLLHGTSTLVLLCELLWLVLGYAFYCWMYAAAGSMAERQDQVQTLALPLSIPILFGYIYSITALSSGHADLFFKVLAYVPFTAPFCMSVLVGLSQVAWWQFVASVVITIVGTAVMATVAAQIYRRAVLQTGARVHLRYLFGGKAAH